MLIFKFPHQDQLYKLDRSCGDTQYNLHSFDGNERLDFRGKMVAITKQEIENIEFELPENDFHHAEESQAEYLKKIEKTVEIIQQNELKKLVIARKKIVNYATIDFPNSFLNLCKKYPSAFVYAFSEHNLAWMGAFSEALGIYDKKTKKFQTMSLAGTLPIAENWSQKEIEEQQPVSDYIWDVLKSYSKTVEQSQTYDHPSGNIKHLRTDFSIEIEEEHVQNLLQDLHPTPAVCGIPKDICQEKILELEGFSREFYAGYSRIETEDFLYSFVNLRCAKFYTDHAEIFVGGGITKDSSPEKEWQETELKSLAIINNLVINR